jgi:hypothetical protein
MSAMEEMLGRMLAKAIPPEVMELLTPEKIKEFGDGISKFITETRANQTAIMEKLAAIEERLDNGGSNSKRGTGKSASGDAPG